MNHLLRLSIVLAFCVDCSPLMVGCFLQSHGTSSPFSKPPSMVGGFGGMPTQFSSNLGNPQPAPFGITPSTSTSSVQIGSGQAPDNGSRFGSAVQGGGPNSSTAPGFGAPAQGGAGFGGSPFGAPAQGGGSNSSTAPGFGAPAQGGVVFAVSNETSSGSSNATSNVKVGVDAPATAPKEVPLKTPSEAPPAAAAVPNEKPPPAAAAAAAPNEKPSRVEGAAAAPNEKPPPAAGAGAALPVAAAKAPAPGLDNNGLPLAIALGSHSSVSAGCGSMGVISRVIECEKKRGSMRAHDDRVRKKKRAHESVTLKVGNFLSIPM